MELITLSSETLNAVMAKLGTLPYVEAAPLIQRIQQDVQQFNNPPATEESSDGD